MAVNTQNSAPLALSGGINFAFDKSDLVAIMEQQLTDGYKAKIKQIREILNERVKIDNKFNNLIATRVREFVASNYSVDALPVDVTALVNAVKVLDTDEDPVVNVQHVIASRYDRNGALLGPGNDALNITITVTAKEKYHTGNEFKGSTTGTFKIVRQVLLPQTILDLKARYDEFRANGKTLLTFSNAVDLERRELPSTLLRVRSTLAKFAYSQSETGRQALDLVGAANTDNLKAATAEMFADLILNKPIPEFNEDLTGIV